MASARTALTFIEAAIKKHNVVVFSKTTCPFSILAKRILTEAGVEDMKVYEIERREDSWEIQVRNCVCVSVRARACARPRLLFCKNAAKFSSNSGTI